MLDWLLVLGKQRRVQFVECPNDINGMIDAAKFADLALLLIDGSYGFEMVRLETINFVIFFFYCFHVDGLNFNGNPDANKMLYPFVC